MAVNCIRSSNPENLIRILKEDHFVQLSHVTSTIPNQNLHFKFRTSALLYLWEHDTRNIQLIDAFKNGVETLNFIN